MGIEVGFGECGFFGEDFVCRVSSVGGKVRMEVFGCGGGPRVSLRCLLY